jgi:hypothetical protein
MADKKSRVNSSIEKRSLRIGSDGGEAITGPRAETKLDKQMGLSCREPERDPMEMRQELLG